MRTPTPLSMDLKDSGRNRPAFSETETAFSSSILLKGRDTEAASKGLWATVPEQRSGEIQQRMKTFGPNISSIQHLRVKVALLTSGYLELSHQISHQGSENSVSVWTKHCLCLK